MENEDLKGFFKANFRFRCEWKFTRIKEITSTTTRPENSASINDFQKWKILENSPKMSVEVKVTNEKAEEKIKLATEKRKINSTDEKLDISKVENISETTTRPENSATTEVSTEKAEEKINSTEKINVTEEPGEKNHATEVSQLNIVQLTTEKEEIKKNEYDKTTNYVDLPKFETENNDKEVRIYFIVTIVVTAVLLIFIGTMIVLILLCKKKSDKKVTNFPLQSLGGDS